MRRRRLRQALGDGHGQVEVYEGYGLCGQLGCGVERGKGGVVPRGEAFCEYAGDRAGVQPAGSKAGEGRTQHPQKGSSGAQLAGGRRAAGTRRVSRQWLPVGRALWGGAVTLARARTGRDQAAPVPVLTSGAPPLAAGCKRPRRGTSQRGSAQGACTHTDRQQGGKGQPRPGLGERFDSPVCHARVCAASGKLALPSAQGHPPASPAHSS